MNKLAITCIGLLATAIAGSQLAMAAPSSGTFQPGASYTITGQEPSTELSVAVLPSSSFASFKGKTDSDGQFTFVIPNNLGSGEYSVLTTKGSQGYEENSTFTVSDSKRMHRSYESDEHQHEHSEHSHNHGQHPHHHNSDHSDPQQTYGIPQFIGAPYGGGFGGGYGKESIAAFASNGAGTSASAKIGLVSLAGLLGAVAFF